MKTPKAKQPLSYDRADQIPPYTSYGWRRLGIDEVMKPGDIFTAATLEVNFGEQSYCQNPGIPNYGFTACYSPHFGRTPIELWGSTPTDAYLVVLRPWFPNRNPLLPKKDKPQL